MSGLALQVQTCFPDSMLHPRYKQIRTQGAVKSFYVVGVNRSWSKKNILNVAVTLRHGPCGAVTRTDENGGLDKVGKLEVDP